MAKYLDLIKNTISSVAATTMVAIFSLLVAFWTGFINFPSSIGIFNSLESQTSVYVEISNHSRTNLEPITFYVQAARNLKLGQASAYCTVKIDKQINSDNYVIRISELAAASNTYLIFTSDAALRTFQFSATQLPSNVSIQQSEGLQTYNVTGAFLIGIFTNFVLILGFLLGINMFEKELKGDLIN